MCQLELVARSMRESRLELFSSCARAARAPFLAACRLSGLSTSASGKAVRCSAWCLSPSRSELYARQPQSSGVLARGRRAPSPRKLSPCAATLCSRAHLAAGGGARRLACLSCLALACCQAVWSAAASVHVPVCVRELPPSSRRPLSADAGGEAHGWQLKPSSSCAASRGSWRSWSSCSAIASRAAACARLSASTACSRAAALRRRAACCCSSSKSGFGSGSAPAGAREGAEQAVPAGAQPPEAHECTACPLPACCSASSSRNAPLIVSAGPGAGGT